jgi:hypothetical protein
MSGAAAREALGEPDDVVELDKATLVKYLPQGIELGVGKDGTVTGIVVYLIDQGDDGPAPYMASGAVTDTGIKRGSTEAAVVRAHGKPTKRSAFGDDPQYINLRYETKGGRVLQYGFTGTKISSVYIGN